MFFSVFPETFRYIMLLDHERIVPNTFQFIASSHVYPKCILKLATKKETDYKYVLSGYVCNICRPHTVVVAALIQTVTSES
jgi:hypothetical protein